MTSKEKVCVPYWTDFCKVINSCLLLPVKTGLQDLDLNLYNTWSNKTVDKSWFSTKLYTVRNQNLPRIYFQSFTSFPIECTDLENTLRKSKKIYLKLSLAQNMYLLALVSKKVSVMILNQIKFVLLYFWHYWGTQL